MVYTPQWRFLHYLSEIKAINNKKPPNPRNGTRRLNVCVVYLLVKGLYIPEDFLTEPRLASVDVASGLVSDFHHIFLR